MINKYLIFSKKHLFLALLFCSSYALGQKRDFGIWYSLGIRYEITKKLNANISEELRTNSNASLSDQYFTDLGLNYKFNKYLSVGGYYRHIKKKENNDNFYARNRFYGDLELSYPFKRFAMSYRFRFQRQVNKFADDIEEKAPRYYNRHRISIEYNIPDFKLTPSVYYEWFYRLKYISPYFADNNRFGLSLDYKFNKRNRIDLSYLINKDLYPETKRLYIISLGYKYTFK